MSKYLQSHQNVIKINHSKVYHVAPKNVLGISSLLNFSKKKRDKLIEDGYRDAQEMLGKYV